MIPFVSYWYHNLPPMDYGPVLPENTANAVRTVGNMVGSWGNPDILGHGGRSYVPGSANARFANSAPPLNDQKKDYPKNVSERAAQYVRSALGKDQEGYKAFSTYQHGAIREAEKATHTEREEKIWKLADTTKQWFFDAEKRNAFARTVKRLGFPKTGSAEQLLSNLLEPGTSKPTERMKSLLGQQLTASELPNEHDQTPETIMPAYLKKIGGTGGSAEGAAIVEAMTQQVLDEVAAQHLTVNDAPLSAADYTKMLADRGYRSDEAQLVYDEVISKEADIEDAIGKFEKIKDSGTVPNVDKQHFEKLASGTIQVLAKLKAGDNNSLNGYYEPIIQKLQKAAGKDSKGKPVDLKYDHKMLADFIAEAKSQVAKAKAAGKVDAPAEDEPAAEKKETPTAAAAAAPASGGRGGRSGRGFRRPAPPAIPAAAPAPAPSIRHMPGAPGAAPAAAAPASGAMPTVNEQRRIDAIMAKAGRNRASVTEDDKQFIQRMASKYPHLARGGR